MSRLAGWIAKDLETQLDELDVERTVVTLHLRSGQRHTGYVLDRKPRVLALQSVPQRGTRDLDVTMIPLAHVEALTLHAVQDVVASPPAPELAESLLELRRRVKRLADTLAARVGRAIAIELGAGELEPLALLFEHVREALDGVCADELGRAALAERVQRIELATGAAGMSLVNGVLSVNGPLAADRVRRELDALL